MGPHVSIPIHGWLNFCEIKYIVGTPLGPAKTLVLTVDFMKVNKGISKNSGKTQKWMVYNGKPYEQMDDVGLFPYFWKHPHPHILSKMMVRRQTLPFEMAPFQVTKGYLLKVPCLS